jgi:hypothetical protein
MTPREFAREQAAAMQRAKSEFERDVVRAWHTAVFSGAAFVGKLMPLNDVLNRMRTEEQNFHEMKTQLQTLSQLTGFPLREVRH